MITNKIRLIELFSGIGAQRSALDRAGVPYESVACCEIDPYAYASYCAIHDDTPNLGDITKVESLPDDIDLLTYSFPCQDLSMAGRQKGMARGSGTRSGLVWEVERLLACSQLPRVLLMENVDAIVNKKNIEQFNIWIKTLSDMGYTSSWKILNASDFDIPQNRKRCFMVSCLDGKCFRFPEGKSKTRHLKDLLEPEVDEKYFLSPERIAKLIVHRDRHQALGHGFGFSVIDVEGDAKCVKSRVREEEDTLIQEGMTPTLKCFSNIGCVQNSRIRRLTPRECWRLMDFSDDEFNKAASTVCHGRKMPESQLYKQAGNAICVGVLAEIFKLLFY